MAWKTDDDGRGERKKEKIKLFTVIKIYEKKLFTSKIKALRGENEINWRRAQSEEISSLQRKIFECIELVF